MRLTEVFEQQVGQRVRVALPEAQVGAVDATRAVPQRLADHRGELPVGLAPVPQHLRQSETGSTWPDDPVDSQTDGGIVCV